MTDIDSPNPPADPESLSTDVVKALVENHRQFLAFLEKRLRDRTLAEDILQDAFVRGMAASGALEREEAATAWFYRILRNSVTDHYRRGGAAHRGLEAFARELEQASEPPADVQEAACRCVAVLAETLKPEYAEALRRVELDGVSVRDYAAEAGITSNNAAVRVFRARDALRKRVARSCGTCAEHGCLDCSCETAPSRA